MWGFGYCCRWMLPAMPLLGLLLWIALLVGAGLLLYALWRNLAGGTARPAAHPDEPLAVLKMRYARGELTREEFQTMARELRDGGGRAP